MLPDLSKSLLDQWNTYFPSTPRPATLNYLSISGSIEGGTVTFLGFPDSSSRPVFAAKVLRDPGFQERALAEYSILSYLQTCGDAVASSVPCPILIKQLGFHFVLVQSILEGQPLGSELKGQAQSSITPTLEQNFILASNWLADLYRLTREDNPSTKVAVLEQTGLVIEEFIRTFELTKSEILLCKEIAGNLGDFTKSGLTVQHRDFVKENILVARPSKDSSPRLKIIDWTDSRRNGYPVHDLFFFLSTYLLQIKLTSQTGPVSIFLENIFFRPNPYQLLFKSTVTNYCNLIDYDKASLTLLFGLFLIEQTMLEYNKILRATRRGTLPKGIIHRAVQHNLSYTNALKEQTWITFFKVFSRNISKVPF